MTFQAIVAFLRHFLLLLLPLLLSLYCAFNRSGYIQIRSTIDWAPNKCGCGALTLYLDLISIVIQRVGASFGAENVPVASNLRSGLVYAPEARLASMCEMTPEGGDFYSRPAILSVSYYHFLLVLYFPVGLVLRGLPTHSPHPPPLHPDSQLARLQCSQVGEMRVASADSDLVNRS